MKASRCLTAAATCLVIVAGGAFGQMDGNSPMEKPTAEPNSVTSVTIAIMDFESAAPGNPELGTQISDIVTARLSIYDQFKLVERKKLEELLREHQLNLTGMIDTNQAVKVGKLVGARIMIFGRAFPVDKDLYLVAKIVGTETSRVKGVIAKGSLESNLSEIMGQLVDKLVTGLEQWTPQLLPPNEKLVNKIAVLKRRLAGRELPTVAVVVPETHVNRRVADPAAQTEIKRVFEEVGFKVVDVRNAGESKDPYLKDADIMVTGEGFSEFGTRIGGLVSCLARLEVQATERQTHRIIASERTTRRAVDLSEAIAGKTALQAAGHELAIRLVQRITQETEDRKSQ
ncbi:MAG TPA: CsgG/HfaB family protein [Sedimentisphaerales bacterium]|nr:CsgG/HfaB family protein [Sedimentisphaerales bacterium]